MFHEGCGGAIVPFPGVRYLGDNIIRSALGCNRCGREINSLEELTCEDPEELFPSVY